MTKKLIGIGLPVVVMDQAIKAIVRRSAAGETIFEIPGIVAITPCTNSGAAFSLLSGKSALLTLLSAILLVLLFLAARSMRLTQAAQTALCLVIGGGVGNLIDRILYNGVTDYIQLQLFRFPVFNLADIVITCGIAVLMLLLLAGKYEDTTGDRHGTED